MAGNYSRGNLCGSSIPMLAIPVVIRLLSRCCHRREMRLYRGARCYILSEIKTATVGIDVKEWPGLTIGITFYFLHCTAVTVSYNAAKTSAIGRGSKICFCARMLLYSDFS